MFLPRLNKTQDFNRGLRAWESLLCLSSKKGVHLQCTNAPSVIRIDNIGPIFPWFSPYNSLIISFHKYNSMMFQPFFLSFFNNPCPVRCTLVLRHPWTRLPPPAALTAAQVVLENWLAPGSWGFIRWIPYRFLMMNPVAVPLPVTLSRAVSSCGWAFWSWLRAFGFMKARQKLGCFAEEETTKIGQGCFKSIQPIWQRRGVEKMEATLADSTDRLIDWYYVWETQVLKDQDSSHQEISGRLTR